MTVIQTIKEINDNQVNGTQYKKGKGTTRAIIDNEGNTVGYIWFNLRGKTLNIDMIEIIEKEEGIGTEVIKFILNTFDIEKIQGQVLVEPSMRAYYFWESLGAEFFHPEVDDIEEAYHQNIAIFFNLEKSS